jgi:hypothetical protein
VKIALPVRLQLASALGLGALVVSLLVNAGPVSGVNWKARVSTELQTVYADAAAVSPAAKPQTPSNLTQAGARFDTKGRVQVDVHVDCAAPAPTAQLAAAGLTVTSTARVPPFCVVEGWVAPSAIPALASVSGVKLVKVPAYATHRLPQAPAGGAMPPANTGALSPGVGLPQAGGGPAIDGNGVSIMRADQYITQTAVNGSGVTVGVMSDDATHMAVIQARGELPSPIQDLTTVANASPTDEGTMMMEEVHAVAPGATLKFCGAPTSVAYVNCVSSLVAAGATILVDDLGYPGEDLMSSQNFVTTGVQNTLTPHPNVALFTVTANMNETYWEGAYAPVPMSSVPGFGSSLTCPSNGQVDTYLESFNGQYWQVLTVKVTKTYEGLLQWADPYDQNVSNFDVYIADLTAGTASCLAAGGSTLTELLGNFSLTAGDTYNILIATPNASLGGKFMKLLVVGNGGTTLSLPTTGSLIAQQAFAPGVMSVGAVSGADGIGNTIEWYSGRGPITLSFPTPTQSQAPSFVAPDAVYVDAAGTDFATAPGGIFPGTSAAAPNAAGVAALLRSAFPSLKPSDLRTAMQSGAVQLGSSVPDGTFGYGRVDAIGALGAIPAPQITGWTATAVTIVGGSSSSSYPMTVTGTGTLRYSVTSNNTALIPASLVAMGTAGVTVTCTGGTTSCAAAFTPAMGQVGAANVTITATDGAGRSASVQSTVTVVKPAAPTVTITANASQTIMEGSAAAAVSFTIAGTGPQSVSAASSNTGLLPTSSIKLAGSGCGPTVNQAACVASLTPSASQSGNATVSFMSRDAYGQTGMGSANLQINAAGAPTKGGGGSVDELTLLALATLGLLKAAERLKST